MAGSRQRSKDLHSGLQSLNRSQNNPNGDCISAPLYFTDRYPPALDQFEDCKLIKMSGKSELPVDGRYVSSSSENSDQEYAGTKTALGSDTLEALRNRVSGGDATFDQTEDPRYYKPIDTYEGIHRWDPEFEWEEWEEKKIVRKVVSSLFNSNVTNWN
ncbi:hypothetical protein EIK77_001417 [Talaromyces pinophilus]|nr:hypothetical protein EIK77_001417 [Talaromyces pinophilus]